MPPTRDITQFRCAHLRTLPPVPYVSEPGKPLPFTPWANWRHSHSRRFDTILSPLNDCKVRSPHGATCTHLPGPSHPHTPWPTFPNRARRPTLVAATLPCAATTLGFSLPCSYRTLYHFSLQTLWTCPLYTCKAPSQRFRYFTPSCTRFGTHLPSPAHTACPCFPRIPTAALFARPLG